MPKQCRLTTKELKKAKAVICREWQKFSSEKYINDPKIKSITLVGSRATGRCKPTSDADFKILLDRIPVCVHVNPKTREVTELPTDRSVVTVDFTRHIDETVRPNVYIDPFIIYRRSEKTYWALPEKHRNTKE